VGTTVTGIQVFRESCVRLQAGGSGEFAMDLHGMVLAAAVRRGKFLWFPLVEAGAQDSVVRGADAAPAMALSAHLGMSGQFRSFTDEPPQPHPHCRARLHLSGPRGPLTLDFIDQRTFGYLVVEPLEPTADGGPGGFGNSMALLPRSVAHIARDALDPLARESGAHEALRRGTRGIKQVLLDQTAVSGIGNIYADEALWWARIHPTTPASSLSGPQAARLFESVRDVMGRALAQGGTSFDALYVNINGESGYFSRDLVAYGRGGEPCLRCGAPVMWERVAGRSTHWCPRCQRRRTPTAFHSGGSPNASPSDTPR
jgi:formamidopyrimidine-DNA glycosylase